MPVIGLLVTLVAGQLYLLGIDHDDMITTIHVGRIGGLVLAADAHRDQRGKTAQNDIRRVDNEPLLFDVLRRCHICSRQRHVYLRYRPPHGKTRQGREHIAPKLQRVIESYPPRVKRFLFSFP